MKIYYYNFRWFWPFIIKLELTRSPYGEKDFSTLVQKYNIPILAGSWLDQNRKIPDFVGNFVK